MRIALLVPGGVDRSGTHRVIPCLLWQIERLAAAGHDVHVFAHAQEPEPAEWPLLGALVHNAGRRPRRARMLGQIAAEHRRAPFDVLHAVWAAPAGTVAALAGRVLRVPVLLHLTGGDLTDLREIGFGARSRRRGRAWVRLAVAGATHITVPSNLLVEQARSLGIHVERLPYGVALDRWPPCPPRPRPPDRSARLLHVGSLNRVKDQTTLLRAAAAMKREGLRFRLDVVGEDTLRGAMQRLASDLALGDVVRFLGFLTHAELRAHVERADLLLVSSRHEADPIVLLEAAVAGVPTVGTAVGHLVDWAPSAAVAVPIGDARGLARETIALLADEDRRLAMAARAQHRAIAEDADNTARRLTEIYASLARREPYRTPVIA
ncbi:MAG TPA: glycosyltransferase family 4 protein [Longimicrobiaceae bacterium]|nr:glycosyltransferase family 4 protein [Longimicrobiaceae bacterium]